MECSRIVLYLLKEAYSVEQAIIEILEEHADETEDIEVRTQLEERIIEIQNQAEKIKTRVEDLDDEISFIRSGLASPIIGMMSIQHDEKNLVLKNTIIEYSLNHYEKATLKVVLTAAEECKDEKTQKICREIIGNERENDEILEQNLIAITTDFINREISEKTDIDFTGEDELF